jgi:hypothetical protein
MNYAIEMEFGAMIYIPSFIKISSKIQKLIREIHTQMGDYTGEYTCRPEGDFISLLLFFSK